MASTRVLTCLIHREDDSFVATCPQIDVASQGDSIEEARANLIEALELFFECSDDREVLRRLNNEVYVTPVEVRVA